ncbi:MAG: hypothetical protein EBU70_08790 [Actinobacteria bacterium]|nr:hypothetical protein [Actinomycetota bacterium]
MPRTGSSIVVIKWRDIPAQVNAQFGRERYQVVLPARFQRAIDRAKRKANIYTAEEDVAQWVRETLPLEGTMEDAANAVAARLEAEFPRERLGRIAYAGGFEKDVEQHDVPAEELAALEELDEEA